MELALILPLGMFVTLLLLIMSGFPVAFCISGTALLFAVIGNALGVFDFRDFNYVPMRVYGVVENLNLIAVPLFVFMGIMLERAGLAKELLESMQYLFRRFKGGLALSVVVVGALLAASTGIVGATVVTMGALSLPSMLAWRYHKGLSCGTICAAGTLGQIIPPSIILVLLGDMISVEIGQLFVGAIIPGAVLVAAYMAYIVMVVWRNPELAPKQTSDDFVFEGSVALYLTRSLLPCTVLIIVVLGSILTGIASPTEASACGAFGACIITGLKRRFELRVLKEVMHATATITAMVFTILTGANLFGVVFKGLEGDAMVHNLLVGNQMAPWVVLMVVMGIMFVLGFFLDFIEICFIVVPVVGPILTGPLGFDALWLAILIAVNLQTSFLTPPFGFALFYLKGVAPEGVSTMDIYKGVLPFVAIQIVVLIMIACIPELVTWLPSVVFAK